MIKHIVLFQFKEENVKTSMGIAKKSLEELRLLESIDYMQIGEDIGNSVYSNFHLSVTCLFTSMEQLDRYQQHSKHIDFSAWLKTVLQQRACVDYII
jgi:hypothetical protein